MVPLKVNGIGQPVLVTTCGNIIVIILAVSAVVAGWLKTKNFGKSVSRNDVLFLFLIYLGLYIFISYVVTGAFRGKFHLNHHLYLVNFVVIMILLGKRFSPFADNPSSGISKGWVFLSVLSVVATILLLALAAVSMHGEIAGSHNRF
jgi:hypothetical protein